MAIELNQFKPNEPVDGLYVYQANLPQLHNPIISANQSTALTYGAVVALDSNVSNADAPVVKQAATTDSIFGVIAFTPVKSTFAAGDRVAIARPNDIIWKKKDSNAISMGATLYFNSSNQVTASGNSGDAVIGRAITSAAAGDAYVQVELGFVAGTAPEPSVTPSEEPSAEPSQG